MKRFNKILLTFLLVIAMFFTLACTKKNDNNNPSDPGTTDPGTTDPGTTDPGTTDPGTTDPGTTDPGGNTDPGELVIPETFVDGLNEEVLLDLSTRSATGTHGAVASANAYASYAGYYTLLKGGNAFDAACAVAFALGVVEPYASGIGGGGVMTCYNAKTGEYLFYNFREFMPAAGTAENYINNNLDWKNGICSAGTPTEVAGLCRIIDDLGTKTYAEVLEPAIYYAEQGFTVQDTLADTIYDSVLEVEAAKAVFSNGRRALRTGEKVVQTDYANVLKEIAEKGVEGYYIGWVADAIVKAFRTNGGLVTQEDLDYAKANYPIIDTPLHGTYNGYDIYTANTPSSGGIIMIETLNMLEHYCKQNNTTLAEIGNNSAEYIHLLATALQLSYADKRHYIADRKIENVPIEGLSNKNYAAQRWDALYSPTNTIRLTSSYDWGGANRDGKGYGADKSPWDYQQTTNLSYSVDPWEDDNGTTSFSVADSEGNIVSFTQTLNHFWGAYVIPENCGFFLNNQLSSFSTTTGSVHYIRPYKQPVSHIMPTIVLKDGDPIATFGSPGSMRIPSAVIETFINLIDFDMDIQEAINNPRIYGYCVSVADSDSMTGGATYVTHKLLEIEDVGLDEGVVSALTNIHYYVKTYNKIDLYFGGVQGITFKYNGDGDLIEIRGGADPRRDGKALAY